MYVCVKGDPPHVMIYRENVSTYTRSNIFLSHPVYKYQYQFVKRERSKMYMF